MIDISRVSHYGAAMISSWRHKGLRDLFLSGTSANVRADQHKKCLRLLDALDQAAQAEDMNLPGLHFHGLHGKPKRFAVAVNGPWRITFRFEKGDAVDVDLEQYH